MLKSSPLKVRVREDGAFGRGVSQREGAALMSEISALAQEAPGRSWPLCYVRTWLKRALAGPGLRLPVPRTVRIALVVSSHGSSSSTKSGLHPYELI